MNYDLGNKGIQALRELVADGANTHHWLNRSVAFVRGSFGDDEAKKLEDITGYASRLGYLQGLLARCENQAERADTIASSSDQTNGLTPTPRTSSRKVFVVHGHDNEAKQTAARFLERIGLEPIILHEKASAGRTIIEKFENYSDDVAFALILLTPDDIGGTAADPSTLRNRARQNVILELGYFMGRLGRPRVCALHRGGVELPSDYQGIVYIELDESSGWKMALAQELVKANLPIKLEGLFSA